MKYSALTQRYFDAAPGAGVLQGPGTFRGAAGARAQGTWVQFDVQLNSVGPAPMIQAARFCAYGCPHVIAVAAWVAAGAVGIDPLRVVPLDVGALRVRFDVPVEKLGRLLIVEDAWMAAVRGAAGQVQCGRQGF